MKSCVDPPHVLQMIVAANACLIAALYHLLEDNFLADFIRKLIIAFKTNLAEELNKTETNWEAEGERPAVYKTRNTLLILCYLYDFDIMNEDFMQDVVLHLADNLNEDTIGHILTIIQNSGFKIRQNSPGSIKVMSKRKIFISNLIGHHRLY